MAVLKHYNINLVLFQIYSGARYYSFHYLDTVGLNDIVKGRDGPATYNCATGVKFEDLYCRFSPNWELSNDRWVTTVVEPCNLFSQLCSEVFCTNVERNTGAQIDSCAYILQKKTFRLWRDWLFWCESISNDPTDYGAVKEESRSNEKPSIPFREFEPILWTDQSRNVGMRVRARRSNSRPDTQTLRSTNEFQRARARWLLGNTNEDQAESYQLELEGMLFELF